MYLSVEYSYFLENIINALFLKHKGERSIKVRTALLGMFLVFLPKLFVLQTVELFILALISSTP